MKNKNIQKEKLIIKIIMFMICLTAIVWMEKSAVGQVRAQGTAKVITDSAKVRAEANTGSTQVGSFKKDETITILEEVKDASGSTWYQVEVSGQKGYIRSDLVTKSGADATTNAKVSASDKTSGTILKDSVRVRKDANTSSDVVATVGRGVALKIEGETKGSDGKTWYSVSFNYNSKTVTGFVRSDFITFEALPEEEPEVTEINGNMGDGETATQTPEGTEVAPEETEVAPPETEEPAEQKPTGTGVEYQLLNVEELPEVPKGYTEVQLSWNDENIRSWKNGSFYIFYARSSEGNEGWYRFDSEESTYQRYDSEIEKSKGGSTVSTIIIIALAVVVVILIILVTMLFMKLNDYKQGGYDDDDDDDDDDDEVSKKEKAKNNWRALNFLSSSDYDDDDDEDDDDEEYDDDEEEDDLPPQRPVRRPMPQNARPMAPQGQAPVRRPAPQGERPVAPQGQTPVRRPAPQGARPVAPQGQAPVRRPVPQGERPMAPQGQAPVRRPAPQGERPMAPQGQAPVRRPAPQGERPMAPQGQAPVRRPAPQGQAPAKRPVPQGNRPRNLDN